MLKIIAPLAAAVALSWAGSAGAAVFVATVKGTVAGTRIFYDGDYFYGAGVMGDPGVNFVGEAFTLTFNYDTITEGNFQNWKSFIDVAGQRFYFGDFYSYQNPPITAAGSTVDVDENINGFVGDVFGLTFTATTPVSISRAGSYQAATPGTGVFIVGAAYGGLSVDSLTISAIPEPATWTMLIVGFGMAGAVLRWRQVMLLAASAAKAGTSVPSRFLAGSRPGV